VQMRQCIVTSVDSVYSDDWQRYITIAAADDVAAAAAARTRVVGNQQTLRWWHAHSMS